MGIPEEPTSALPKEQTNLDMERRPPFFASYENLMHTGYHGHWGQAMCS